MATNTGVTVLDNSDVLRTYLLKNRVCSQNESKKNGWKMERKEKPASLLHESSKTRPITIGHKNSTF